MSFRVASFSVATAATDTIVAAVPGRSIHVHAACLFGNADNTLASFADGGASISQFIRMANNGNVILPMSPSVAYLATGQSNLLTLNATTGTVTGWIVYRLV